MKKTHLGIAALVVLVMAIYFAIPERRGFEELPEKRIESDSLSLRPGNDLPDSVADAPVEEALTGPQYPEGYDQLPDSALVDLKALYPDFILDVKYASTENFTNQVLYECEKCLLRKVAADSLIKAAEYLKEQGYLIILFDCYRPNYVQWLMWEIVPDPRYVADPAKGSMHNRGAAVDLGLADLEGNELDMGSPFDTFGQVSHHAYQDLPSEVLQRRLLLKEVMDRFGFAAITSEWWHYSYRFQNFHILNKKLCEEL